MNDEPCTLEHLQAAVPLYYMFDAKSDGDLGDEWQEWDDPRDSTCGEIAEYHCDNCGEYFPLDKKYSEEARAKAWQAALAHLTEEKEVA